MEKNNNMSKKSTLEEFIVKSISIHGQKYNYTNSIYLGRKFKIEIKCNTCLDIFWQLPSDHISKKSGCPQCGGVKKSNTQDFIQKANGKHSINKYDYSNTDYVNARIKVTIRCNDCNMTFLQSPRDHLSGYGCPQCPLVNQKWKQDEIINAFVKIHDNKYDYSEVIYIDTATPIKIWCNKCNEFFTQTPGVHLEGKGHLKCCANNISKQEISWLNYLSIPLENRNIELKIGNNTFKVDAYDISTNTIYEFNGDYWHGNPKVFDPNDHNKNNKKTFGELYQKTIDKEQALIAVGYKVISIWESDWKEQCKQRS